MKKLFGAVFISIISIISILSISSIAQAGARVEVKETEQQVRDRTWHQAYDHPLTQFVASDKLKVDITKDAIMHSCCMPPNLVVAGKITNVAGHPIDYVHLLFRFEDKQGKVLHSEGLYNSKAASMNDDEYMAKVLGEKPHFTPLNAGETDTFSFGIPTTELPEFQKVELVADDVKP
jgi:hypothetical protein